MLSLPRRPPRLTPRPTALLTATVAATLTLALLAPAAALLCRSRDAQAQEATPSCLPAYENTQLRRMKGEFRAARDAAKTCSQATCQQALRSDCLQWLAELDRTIPSVVLGARSDRGEEVEVKVLLDGAPLVSRLDGAPIELDPGPHTFSFEMSGRPPVEQKVVLKAGDKLRSISASFETRARDAPPPASSSPGQGLPPQPMERPVPTLAYVMGGIAIGGGLAFGALAISGYAKHRSLEDGCAPFCSSSEVNSVRVRYVLADISLGVGVVSLGAATLLYLTRPEVPLRDERSGSRGSFDIALTGSSAAVGYGRSF